MYTYIYMFCFVSERERAGGEVDPLTMAFNKYTAMEARKARLQELQLLIQVDPTGGHEATLRTFLMSRGEVAVAGDDVDGDDDEVGEVDGASDDVDGDDDAGSGVDGAGDDVDGDDDAVGEVVVVGAGVV